MTFVHNTRCHGVSERHNKHYTPKKIGFITKKMNLFHVSYKITSYILFYYFLLFNIKIYNY